MYQLQSQGHVWKPRCISNMPASDGEARGALHLVSIKDADELIPRDHSAWGIELGADVVDVA